MALAVRGLRCGGRRGGDDPHRERGGASTPERPPGGVERFGEILHTPVLLARGGSPVALKYDFGCGVPRHEPGGGCSPQGSVFVRPAGESEFAEVPLRRDESGMLTATVNTPEAGQGFDYYAEIDNGRGQAARLPAGATRAPHHVWPLETPTQVALDAEPFGSTRAPGSIAATFAWGRGAQALGLDSGREQARIGPSAFDVAPDGSIVVLDQVNRRLTVVGPGERPRQMPIQFTGGEGDLAVGGDGKIYVLDAARPPVVRSFTAGGYPLAGTRLAEATADMVRAGPDGPLVHAYPSEMWLPTGADRPPLSPSEQLAAAELRLVESRAALLSWSAPLPPSSRWRSFGATEWPTHGSSTAPPALVRFRWRSRSGQGCSSSSGSGPRNRPSSESCG